ASLREVAERQTVLASAEIRHSAQPQRGRNGWVIRVGLLVRGVIPVVAEAELIGECRAEDMGLAEHEVHREDEIALAAVAAAVENGAEGKRVEDDVVQIAVTGVGLVPGADVPVNALNPLDGIVGLRNVL